MDGQGLSLFQGAESIKLNNDQQRIEEEDAVQDRLRRNEEVRNGIFHIIMSNKMKLIRCALHFFFVF